ncbi:MAG TPA: thiamine diphosphokinase [Clostridiales bacterium]|nr:thiamine diphosphokinase [Clostridiales bacterium]
MNRCILICASPDIDIDYCKSIITRDDHIFCADGGYDYAKEIGVVPRLVVGDFDSAHSKKILADQVITLPTQKDDTDTMYCIKEIIKRGYRDIAILGGMGGRLDHTLANITALKYLADNGCVGRLLDKSSVIHYCVDKLTIGGNNNTVSIFPFACEKAEVSLSGFRYTLNHFQMTASFPLGISNVAENEASEINVYSGGVIVIEYLSSC